MYENQTYNETINRRLILFFPIRTYTLRQLSYCFISSKKHSYKKLLFCIWKKCWMACVTSALLPKCLLSRAFFKDRNRWMLLVQDQECMMVGQLIPNQELRVFVIAFIERGLALPSNNILISDVRRRGC